MKSDLLELHIGFSWTLGKYSHRILDIILCNGSQHCKSSDVFPLNFSNLCPIACIHNTIQNHVPLSKGLSNISLSKNFFLSDLYSWYWLYCDNLWSKLNFCLGVFKMKTLTSIANKQALFFPKEFQSKTETIGGSVQKLRVCYEEVLQPGITKLSLYYLKVKGTQQCFGKRHIVCFMKVGWPSLSVRREQNCILKGLIENLIKWDLCILSPISATVELNWNGIS